MSRTRAASLARSAAVLAALVIHAVPSAARAAPGEITADSHFTQPVTLAVREQPLGDFLGALRKDQHLPVRADASTQDERITIFCRERPAGEILAAVARHLDYTWVSRAKEGQPEYVLVQSRAQREHERQLREDFQAAALAALQRKAAEDQAEGRRTPEERRRRAIERLQQRAAAAPDTETRQLIEEDIQDLAQGTVRRIRPNSSREALAAVLAALRPEEWDRLWEGQPYRFAYPARPGPASLTEQQAAAIVRARVEELRQTADEEGHVLSRGTFAGVERVRGELVLDLDSRVPQLQLHCRCLARQPGARVRSYVHGIEAAWFPWDGPSGDPVVDPRDTDLQRPIDIPPSPVPLADPGDEKPWLDDVVETLQPRLPYTLIADAYDDDGEGKPLPRGRQRLDAWLRDVGEQLNVQVRREEGTLFFRHREWFRICPREVPRAGCAAGRRWWPATVLFPFPRSARWRRHSPGASSATCSTGGSTARPPWRATSTFSSSISATSGRRRRCACSPRSLPPSVSSSWGPATRRSFSGVSHRRRSSASGTPGSTCPLGTLSGKG